MKKNYTAKVVAILAILGLIVAIFAPLMVLR